MASASPDPKGSVSGARMASDRAATVRISPVRTTRAFLNRLDLSRNAIAPASTGTMTLQKIQNSNISTTSDG